MDSLFRVLCRHLRTIWSKARQWTLKRRRELKAQMTGRRAARKKLMKQVVYARMAAVVRHGKEDAADATGKCGARDAKADEATEEDREGPDAQGEDDVDAFEALFNSLSLAPELSFDVWRRSARRPLTPALPEEAEPRFKLGLGHPLPSPTFSYASSGSRGTPAPTTPTTPLSFPGTRSVDGTALARPRPHLRIHPRPRNHFRTLSASITARSPLSLSFPLSLSLPLAARRASSPGTAMHSRYMDDEEQDKDGGDDRGRPGGTATGAAGNGEEGVGEGEDPFSTHGREYYAPGACAAIGVSNAYDLSAWAWACDSSPNRRAKKRKRHAHASRPMSATVSAADAGTGSGHGSAIVGSGSVYHAPMHAASAPQLSSMQHPDREMEYLRALAHAIARGSVARSPAPMRANAYHRAPGHRGGIRPLLLPQKLGLPGTGITERETAKDDTVVSSGHGRRATGWELDLERGVCEDNTAGI
ncbi:hypothetical protein BC826DRAFT_1118056 [Russula brevipes]|nr:hypothetical protein BC826DRAFT_1118056 [Russula brevipes]